MTKSLWKTNRLNLIYFQLKSFHSINRNGNLKQILTTPIKTPNFKEFLQQARLINTTKPIANNKNQLKVFYIIYNTLQYAFIFTVTAGVGLFTGYYFLTPNDDKLQLNGTEYQPTKVIENKKNDYPLRLHLYQYESCPSCTQIRAYLDYFGISYKLTEVDSFSKNDSLSFTMNRVLPVLVFQHKDNKQQRWHLANATAILSALESLRNEVILTSDLLDENTELNYSDILNKYLPVLKGNEVQAIINPFKYHVSNSDLNSVEWRRWIDDTALPVFKLNSICSLKDLSETFDMYSAKSNWETRYQNKFKYYYVYYVNMFKAYFSEVSNLKKSLKIKAEVNPRQLLIDAITKWEDGLDQNEFISGNDPNLADISMFGTVNSFDGCNFLKESFEKHFKFSNWYKRMKERLAQGYVAPQEKKEIIEDEALSGDDKPVEIAETKQIDSSASVNQMTQSSSLRILSAIYLVHILAFTYAAYMAPK